jgi:hypothetical protein
MSGKYRLWASVLCVLLLVAAVPQSTLAAPGQSVYLPLVFSRFRPPTVLTVGPSGQFATIQAAIDAAQPSEAYEIRVACGIYAENIAVPAVKSVRLQGGWNTDYTSVSGDNSLTVIDGGARGSVLTMELGNGTQSELQIEAFTIRNGLATVPWHGGGIHIVVLDAGSKLTLEFANNTISDNHSSDRGGGVFMEAEKTASLDARFTRNTITDNTTGNEGGGLRMASRSGASTAVTLTDNTIARNTVTNHIDGGGIAAYAQTAGTTTLFLAHNVITQNESGFGGGILGYAWQANALLDVTLTNNIIANNTATMMGSAIYTLAGVSGTFTQPGGSVYWHLNNNTITGNSATTIGDAVALYSGSTFGDGGLISLSSHNDIIWGNFDLHKNAQIDVIVEPGRAGVAAVNVEYSLVGDVETRASGTYTSQHTLHADPMFVAPGDLDFTLADGSPAIDAGDPNPVYNDGHRPPGKGTARADMGAYGGPHNDWP